MSASYLRHYLIDIMYYLLTPWCRVLPEQPTGLQLLKKFPAFHGTRRFITALRSVRHLSLSWASPIQSTYSHPTSWRFILILSTHLSLGLPSSLFPSGFPTKLSATVPYSYMNKTTRSEKQNPAGDEIFCPSRPALGPTQPPVKWVPGHSRV